MSANAVNRIILRFSSPSRLMVGLSALARMMSLSLASLASRSGVTLLASVIKASSNSSSRSVSSGNGTSMAGVALKSSKSPSR